MIYFGTATLQHCSSECRAELAPAMPSASSLDEVNAATANLAGLDYARRC